MIEVIPTDHPKSVRNRCVIEHFGGVLRRHFALSMFYLCFYYRAKSNIFPFSKQLRDYEAMA